MKTIPNFEDFVKESKSTEDNIEVINEAKVDTFELSNKILNFMVDNELLSKNKKTAELVDKMKGLLDRQGVK